MKGSTKELSSAVEVRPSKKRTKNFPQYTSPPQKLTSAGGIQAHNHHWIADLKTQACYEQIFGMIEEATNMKVSKTIVIRRAIQHYFSYLSDLQDMTPAQLRKAIEEERRELIKAAAMKNPSRVGWQL